MYQAGVAKTQRHVYLSASAVTWPRNPASWQHDEHQGKGDTSKCCNM